MATSAPRRACAIPIGPGRAAEMSRAGSAGRPGGMARVAGQGLDPTARRGEIVGFLGPHGAGEAIASAPLPGLVAPTAGRAALLGRIPGPALARAGAIVETSASSPDRSGLDNRQACVARRAGTWRAFGRNRHDGARSDR